MKSNKAIFASGCFWGTQYYFDKAPGVIKTVVGYTGGDVKSPTYDQVSRGDTGHVEAVEVTYDPAITTYQELTKLFFETHDPTQRNGQGPDIGEQYKSVIFYSDKAEEKIARKLIALLEEKGMDIATTTKKRTTFYPAEEYHQGYYERIGGSPYCHVYRKLF